MSCSAGRDRDSWSLESEEIEETAEWTQNRAEAIPNAGEVISADHDRIVVLEARVCFWIDALGKVELDQPLGHSAIGIESDKVHLIFISADVIKAPSEEDCLIEGGIRRYIATAPSIAD